MAFAEICDLCEMEGERRFTTGRYWDETGKEWEVCAAHLEAVKKSGLEYEEYEKEE